MPAGTRGVLAGTHAWCARYPWHTMFTSQLQSYPWRTSYLYPVGNFVTVAYMLYATDSSVSVASYQWRTAVRHG
jgi:hypothetical protein